MRSILGGRIRELRVSRNWKQDDLAAKLGVDRTTVGSYEQNRREPDIDSLCLIADLFGVSLDWLVGRETSIEIKEKTVEDQQWEEIRRLASENSLNLNDIIHLLELIGRIRTGKA
jgi:transcriptional regulator with XRE-family HTH domain